MVRRGSDPGTLDRSLKEQALAAGVEIRFGETVRHPPPGSLVAWGPRRADSLAVGYLFETDLADGAFVVLDHRVAPRGYGYLLIHGGQGTLSVFLVRDFHDESAALDRLVEFFARRLGLAMRRPRRFGGIGNVHRASPDSAGHVLWAGEAVGAQDALWGFGIRYAILSGQLAAFPAADPESHRRLWEETLGRPLRASFVNRYLYEKAGNLGQRWLLWRLGKSPDPRRYLQRLYRPTLWKRAMFPLIYGRVSKREDVKTGCCCASCAEPASVA